MEQVLSGPAPVEIDPDTGKLMFDTRNLQLKHGETKRVKWVVAATDVSEARSTKTIRLDVESKEKVVPIDADNREDDSELRVTRFSESTRDGVQALRDQQSNNHRRGRGRMKYADLNRNELCHLRHVRV